MGTTMNRPAFSTVLVVLWAVSISVRLRAKVAKTRGAAQSKVGKTGFRGLCAGPEGAGRRIWVLRRHEGRSSCGTKEGGKRHFWGTSAGPSPERNKLDSAMRNRRGVRRGDGPPPASLLMNGTQARRRGSRIYKKRKERRARLGAPVKKPGNPRHSRRHPFLGPRQECGNRGSAIPVDGRFS